MKKKALRDEVFVRPIIKEKTQSGLIIPESARTCMRGEVVSIGTRLMHGKKEKEFEVSVGDIIFFANGTGKSITFDDEKLLMLRHNDIMGTIS